MVLVAMVAMETNDFWLRDFLIAQRPALEYDLNVQGIQPQNSSRKWTSSGPAWLRNVTISCQARQTQNASSVNM